MKWKLLLLEHGLLLPRKRIRGFQDSRVQEKNTKLLFPSLDPLNPRILEPLIFKEVYSRVAGEGDAHPPWFSGIPGHGSIWVGCIREV